MIIDALILGIVQGLTEFIPVSSSGHLILVGQWLNFSGSDLIFDVALNIGTLAAVSWYFREDLLRLGRSLVVKSEQTRLAWLLIIATIPAFVAGALVEDKAASSFRSPQLIAVALILVGVLMWAIDQWAPQKRGLKSFNLPTSLGIGFAQAIALVPGVSRSGITISGGRLAGFDRISATRLSFLLSVPVIAGATAKVMISSATWHEVAAAPAVFTVGILASLVSGYLAIRFMLTYLSRHGLAIFAYYRIILGILILVSGFGR